MFHENAHIETWNRLHAALKRGDLEAVAREWHASLTSMATHYDDLRMLYYVGRFGLRPAYTRACETLGYLRSTPPHILRYRLAIFRYAVETSARKPEARKNWMLEDLSKVLRINLADFPIASPDVPEEFAAMIAKANPRKRKKR